MDPLAAARHITLTLPFRIKCEPSLCEGDCTIGNELGRSINLCCRSEECLPGLRIAYVRLALGQSLLELHPESGRTDGL